MKMTADEKAYKKFYDQIEANNPAPNKAQHSPLPWTFHWENPSEDWAIITNGAGNIIANVNTETGPDATSAPATRKMPCEANARLIVASVNHAGKLAEALRDIETLAQCTVPQSNIAGHLRAIESKARAVLAAYESEVAQ